MPKLDLIWTQPPPPARTRSLGRAEIVAAAIALADESGAEALTMKAVAARLGPYTPMALYRYIHSKEGLIDLMLDTAAATVATTPTEPGSGWRDDLRGIALATREMIKKHPWYASLANQRPPVGPHTMRRTESMLAPLVGSGASTPDAMAYAALIDRHVIGSGLQEAQEAAFQRSQGLTDAAGVMAALTSVHDLAVGYGDVPLLAAWLAKPAGATADQQFALGLEFLLDGIAGRLPAR